MIVQQFVSPLVIIVWHLSFPLNGVQNINVNVRVLLLLYTICKANATIN